MLEAKLLSLSVAGVLVVSAIAYAILHRKDVGNGRFFAMRHDIPTFMRTFGYPQMRLQLEMEMADGKVERVCSDETWKVTADGPIRHKRERPATKA